MSAFYLVLPPQTYFITKIVDFSHVHGRQLHGQISRNDTAGNQNIGAMLNEIIYVERQSVLKELHVQTVVLLGCRLPCHVRVSDFAFRGSGSLCSGSCSEAVASRTDVIGVG